MNTLIYLDSIMEAVQAQQAQGPPPPSPQQIQAQITAANTENIQSYILFNKILSLKYQLENSELVKTDYKTYSDAMYFLNTIISFFSSFSLNDLNVSINYVLDNIIKSTQLVDPDLGLVTDPKTQAKK